jgi:hypothetical protein
MFPKSMKIFLTLLLISVQGLSYGSDSTASSSSSSAPSSGDAGGTPEPQEEIRYRKISSTGNHVDGPRSFLQMSSPYFTGPNPYFEDWHREQQNRVREIDANLSKFFSREGKAFTKNICSIRLTLRTRDLNNIPLNFDEIIFVSGKSLEPQPHIAENIFLCIDDFYPDLFNYRQSIIEYFDLKIALGGQVREMKRFFKEKIEQLIPQGENEEGIKTRKSNIDKINQIYDNSLRFYAPFSQSSIDKLALLRINGGEGLAQGLDELKNFCDSEQSIRLFLTGRFLKINEKREKTTTAWRILKDHLSSLNLDDITGVFIDIASRRHMCDTCYGTYKYDVEGGRGMLRNILRQLNFGRIFDDSFINNLNYEFLISGSIDHGK